MNDCKTVADIVERFVNGKVLMLQKSYLAGSSSSRATLARLRRLGQPGMGSWMVVGDDVFSDLPELCTSRVDEEDALRAIRCAMKLYAIHQQSEVVGVAIPPSSMDWTSGSFGRACYLISHQAGSAPQGEAGVLRRMSTIESATGFEGVEAGLRALISLMKSKGVKLNYGRLARDIYFIQKSSARDRVFMGWARDYYVPRKQDARDTSN